uniref:zinc finger CCHC domain-containing protein 8 isoform X2 n=1 Tax=Myxine glutinosa TaxID=7769 RepID=UPI00358F4EA4
MAKHSRFSDSDSEEDSGLSPLLACEEKVAQLQDENDSLRRQIRLLTRPSGITVQEVWRDGPLVHVIFMDNLLSRRYYSEVEDFLKKLLERVEREQSGTDKLPSNLKPQPASVVLRCHCKDHASSPEADRAFTAVGSVQYYHKFCVDCMGQPLINNNPAHDDNWKLPKYNQVFPSILTGDDKVQQVKAKRPKPCCFNCRSEHHQLKDCPKPRDLVKIGQSRREFLVHSGENYRSSGPQVRYHVENSQVFEHFKPGIYSSDLQEALGMVENHLPPFIYRMRQLGYPPGWLREAETESSGLTIHDSEGLCDGEINDDSDKIPQDQQVTYDFGKVVDFPGFNTPPHPNTRDEWKSYGSVPMLSQHSKEALLITLSAKSQKVVRIKRRHIAPEPEAPNPNKHRRAWNENRHESDMEIDSGTDTSDQTPQHLPEYDLHWKPPLPPPSQNQTPPPLPSDTPPSNSPVTSRPAYLFNPPLPPTSTPPPLPKETPPPSPFNCSQGSSPVQPPDVPVVDEQMDTESLTWKTWRSMNALFVPHCSSLKAVMVRLVLHHCLCPHSLRVAATV